MRYFVAAAAVVATAHAAGVTAAILRAEVRSALAAELVVATMVATGASQHHRHLCERTPCPRSASDILDSLVGITTPTRRPPHTPL